MVGPASLGDLQRQHKAVEIETEKHRKDYWRARAKKEAALARQVELQNQRLERELSREMEGK